MTDRRTDIASGLVRDIAAGPALSPLPATLPAEVAGLPADDLASIGTDGTAFGWVNRLAEDGKGIGYWSPQTGVVNVNGIDLRDSRGYFQRAVVFDSFVIVNAGGSAAHSATFVDTRSGAVVRLTPRNPGQPDRAIASMGGTLALARWTRRGREPKQSVSTVGMLREGALNSPSC